MVTLRRIGVRSAGRVGLWLGVGLSLIQIMIILTLTVVFFRVPISELLHPQLLIRIAISIAFSAANAALTAVIFAFVYNVTSRASGGLQLDFEMPDTPTDKRKNGEDETDYV